MKTINTDNYEAFLLDRMENSLSAEQERELDEFLSQHPELNDGIAEFNSDIKFEYSTNGEFLRKNKLYKPVFIIPNWVKAAAVVLVIVAVSYFSYIFIDTTKTNAPIAKVNTQPIATNSQQESLATEENMFNSDKVSKTSATNETRQQKIPQVTEEIIATIEEMPLIAENTEVKTEENPVNSQTEPKESTSLIVYKQADRVETQNLIAYAPTHATGLRKVINNSREFLNKIRG
ncbi:MAG: hypothetical protein IJ759_04040 [Bacteroidales bacterium]|nr:hypothetical protein [Bacteroidales bacterium]